MPRSGSDASSDSFNSRGSFKKITSSLRHSVASAVSVVEEKIAVGTVGGTVLNTICNVIGGGVLGLPQAFQQMGIFGAVVVALLMTGIAMFSAYVLFVACDRTGEYFMNGCFATSILGKRGPRPGAPSGSSQGTHVGAKGRVQGEGLTMPPDDVDEAPVAANEWKRTILAMMVDGCILLNNYLILGYYCGVMIDTITSVLKQFAHADGIWVEKSTWVIISSVIFFALTSVRNMSELKWSSLLGISTIMWAIAAVVGKYVAFQYQMPGEAIYNTFQGTNLWPSAIGVFSVALGYHYNAPTFYHELQDRSPRKMMKTVVIAFPVILVAYLATGIFGYLSFGEHVKGMIMDNYGTYDTVINTVRLGLFFHFACVYPVLSVCLRHSAHRFILTLLGRRQEAIREDMPATVPRWMIMLEAFVIVASSSYLAYAYRDLGKLLSLIGSLCGNNFMMTIPGVIGMCIWSNPPEGEHIALLDNDDQASPDHHSDVGGWVPPPFWKHRHIFFWLSALIAVLGLVMTVLGFALVVLPQSN